MIISVGYFSLIAGRLTVVVLKDTVFVDDVRSNKLDVLWYVCLRGAYSGGSHLKKTLDNKSSFNIEGATFK